LPGLVEGLVFKKNTISYKNRKGLGLQEREFSRGKVFKRESFQEGITSTKNFTQNQSPAESDSSLKKLVFPPARFFNFRRSESEINFLG
jgi:hypothetical protein